MEDESPRYGVAGILIFGTFVEVIAMAHHPSFATADVATATRGILTTNSIAAWVHGVLITLMLLIAFCMSEFAVREGARRPLIRAGTIGYGAGVILMIGAALVSGFVVPNLVTSLAAVPVLDAQLMRALLILCRMLNQSCANASVLATSGGIACWSIALLRKPGRAQSSAPQQESGLRRGVGAVGCLVALIPAAGLLSSVMSLNLHGMSAVLMIQGLWNIAVAVLLVRRSR